MSGYKLDEKGFVFIDHSGRPYWVRLWHDLPWIFFWHRDNHWTAYTLLTYEEANAFPHNLDENEQNKFHKAHEEWLKK